ncbi:MAG: preprotein translocase subunit YajC [Bacteroidales bacterium]|nr:preprotein translocase subunit YajC [Bacteroidales bacterium]
MNLLNILLQTAAPKGAGYTGIIMMLLIFVVFYLFMIRPQTKKQKEIRAQREAMQRGDKVVTSGGIYGKIRDIKETTFTIEIADNVRITVDKNSVFATAQDINEIK